VKKEKDETMRDEERNRMGRGRSKLYTQIPVFEIYGCERADDLPWKKRRVEKEKQVENRAIQDLLFC